MRLNLVYNSDCKFSGNPLLMNLLAEIRTRGVKEERRRNLRTQKKERDEGYRTTRTLSQYWRYGRPKEWNVVLIGVFMIHNDVSDIWCFTYWPRPRYVSPSGVVGPYLRPPVLSSPHFLSVCGYLTKIGWIKLTVVKIGPLDRRVGSKTVLYRLYRTQTKRRLYIHWVSE